MLPPALPWSRRGVVLGAGFGAIALSAAAVLPARSEPMTCDAALEALLHRYAEAWSRGDLAAMRACYHPDFTLHYFGHNALAGDHVGLAAALKTLAAFSQRTGRRLVSIVDVTAGMSRGAIIVCERFGEGAGSVEVERVLAYRAADGLLIECWVYDQDQDLIDKHIGL